MKKSAKKNYQFPKFTFRGSQVFLTTEVSFYLNRSMAYVYNRLKNDEYVKGRHYIRLTDDENKEFVKENKKALENSNVKNNTMQIRNLLTLEGFQKIHEYSSDSPFPLILDKENVISCLEECYKNQKLEDTVMHGIYWESEVWEAIDKAADKIGPKMKSRLVNDVMKQYLKENGYLKKS